MSVANVPENRIQGKWYRKCKGPVAGFSDHCGDEYGTSVESMGGVEDENHMFR